MLRNRVAAACAAVMSLFLMGLQSRANAADDTILYAALAPLSGSAASWGIVETASAELAVNRINANGGVKIGDKIYKLRFKAYDHGYEPTKAATVAREAIEQDGAKFVGLVGAGVAPAVQPIAERNNALIFCYCLGTAFLGEKHPTSFKPFLNELQSLDAILRVYVKAHPQAKRVAQIYTDDDLGRNWGPRTAAIYSKAGLTGDVEYVSRKATDLYPVLTKALAKNPDAIDTGPAPQGLYDAIVKQSRELGFKGQFIFPDMLTFPSSSQNLPAGALVGSYHAPCTVGDGSSDLAKWWAGEIRKKLKQPPEWWTAWSFDNVLLVAEALKKAQTLDSLKVRDALETVTVEGVTSGGATVRYQPDDAIKQARTFAIPYNVCEIKVGGPEGRGVDTQVAAGAK